jgi:hypothetical protein
MEFLLECFVLFGQIGAFGSELIDYVVEFFFFFCLFRAYSLEDCIFLLLFFEDVLDGHQCLVFLVLEVVVLAGQLVDLVL